MPKPLASYLPAMPWQLRRRGILGMNARNLDCLLRHNPRHLYPLVDDKIATKRLCHENHLPIPQTYAVIKRYSDLDTLANRLDPFPSFVAKPAHGAGGRGILVLQRQPDATYQTPGHRSLTIDQLHAHFRATLAGVHSLGGRHDSIIIEQLIVCHPLFSQLTSGGTPDIRLIIYRGLPAMAMIRLPTHASHARSNLHQGAIGAGIHLATGITQSGVYRDRMIDHHPDSGLTIHGVQIPDWQHIIHSATRLAHLLGLGYIGVDIMLDATHGPLIIEANARPGLAIQTANRAGILPRLDYIDQLPPETRQAPPDPALLHQIAAR